MAAVTSLLCLSSSSIQAETVELKNGDVLSGDINSLDKDHVALNSPLASNPLEIKAASIDRIVFPDQAKDTPTPTHTERLNLTNNDVIPCKVISMDGKNLHISTWYAGKFSIPRSSIHSLQFGISEDESIYKGDDSLSKWSMNEGNWTQSGSSYSCRGSGTIARKLDLAKNVRFSFDLSWKEKPNFVFRFCAEKNSSMTKQDTYELIFNSTGMQIRRFENSKHPGTPLADIPIKPHTISEQRLHIDLRVNRDSQLITLFINGKMEGTWQDPFAESKGNYIILNSRSKNGTCIIGNLQVSSIHDGSLPRHRENSRINKTDVLLDSEGEKFSGSITSISEAEPNKRKITFAANYSADPIKVPDRRVSTLFFAQSEKDAPASPTTTFTAMLAGNGAIQLENPTLKNDEMICHHPILGQFKINIKALTHIKQSNAKAAPQKAN